jgi:hypothetical protein
MKKMILSLSGIYVLAWLMQSYLLLNWDVAWLMHAAGKLLAGGSYSKDFFEWNPPMILYLSMPPVLLSKVGWLSLVQAEHVYVFFIASISLLLCWHGNRIFIVVLAICYLIVPVYEFGQREHLMLMLTMPYILSVAYKQQKYNILNSILAGIGFALKPYFLIVPLLLEIYNGKPIRLETLIIISILLAYLATIFLFYPDYIHAVIPLALRLYHQGFNAPWKNLLCHPAAIFCYVVIVFYFVSSRDRLKTVLFLALIGFLFAFFMQKTAWYYHLYPAFVFAILLASVMLADYRSDLLFLSLLIPVYTLFNLTSWGMEYRNKSLTLVEYMIKHAPHQPVYFFSMTSVYAYPAVIYAESISASRFAFLGWLPGLLKKNNDDKTFLLSLLAEYFNTAQPELVFVDNTQFNYIKYFSDDQAFKQVWKNYRYRETIQCKNYYTLAVYQRKTT